MPDYSSNVMMESKEGLIHLSALKKEVRSKKCENLSNTLVTKKSVHEVLCLKIKFATGSFFKKSEKQIKISSILALLAASSDSTHSTLCSQSVLIPATYAKFLGARIQSCFMPMCIF